MLYHERDGKIEENAKFVHIVYLLAKLYNIFGEASVYIIKFLGLRLNNRMTAFHRVDGTQVSPVVLKMVTRHKDRSDIESGFGAKRKGANGTGTARRAYNQ